MGKVNVGEMWHIMANPREEMGARACRAVPHRSPRPRSCQDAQKLSSWHRDCEDLEQRYALGGPLAESFPEWDASMCPGTQWMDMERHHVLCGELPRWIHATCRSSSDPCFTIETRSPIDLCGEAGSKPATTCPYHHHGNHPTVWVVGHQDDREASRCRSTHSSALQLRPVFIGMIWIEWCGTEGADALMMVKWRLVRRFNDADS